MNHANHMISLSGVSLTLAGGAGPVNVLRNVSFSLERGRSASLTGPSGAGKTSLLMVVSGLERATAGTVRVAGQDISAMGEDQLARFRLGHVGIVFQAFHLLPSMTAEENVALPLELAGRPGARDTARRWLAAVGLENRRGHFPAELSGGEQQRVALARAFAPEPDLILADEPTGNLDAATGREVMDLLFGLQARRGATLLLVTHDQGLAGRCQESLRMADGAVEA